MAAHDGARHDKRPKGSHRVGFDGLQHRHGVLCVFRLDRIRLVIGNVCLFGIDSWLLDLQGMM